VSHVNVTISGRQYRMACEEGQEQRLQGLADDFESRIVALRKKFGEVGDARLTVMAAIMIADELLDAKQERSRLEIDVAALQVARASANERAHRSEAAMLVALDEAAERIEKLTQALSRPAGGGMAFG